ncbi:MAG TPA: beta-galactosidase [Chthoniobacterales bacterium]|jgi:hypothetical protein
MKISPAQWRLKAAKTLSLPSSSRAVIVALSGLLSANLACAGLGPQPRGVFSMTINDSPTKAAVLNNPNVDGISLRCNWSTVEPTEGQFDFSYFDSAVAAAGTAHKQVLLRVNTMAQRPAWVDAAITKAGGQFFTFSANGVQTTIPVFWDPTFVAKKIALIAALGAHFTNNPTVTTVWTSFANAQLEDWNVPHTANLLPQWYALGYSTTKMLAVGEQIIDATMRAFPNQYVTLAIGGDGPKLDPSLMYVSSTTLATERTAWPNRLFAQRNSLSDVVEAPPGTFAGIWRLIWDSRPLVAAQMLAPCYGDSTYRMNNGVPIDPDTALKKAVDIGLSYGVSYLEIPQIDVVNSPTVISYAHSAMTSQ